MATNYASTVDLTVVDPEQLSGKRLGELLRQQGLDASTTAEAHVVQVRLSLDLDDTSQAQQASEEQLREVLGRAGVDDAAVRIGPATTQTSS